MGLSSLHSIEIRASRLALIAIILVGILAFTSYYYVQTLTETNVRNALFEQQKKTQTDNTRALGEHISADLDNISHTFEILSSKPAIQRGELAGEINDILTQADAEINKQTLNDGIVVLDADNKVVQSTNYPQLVGVDASFREYIIAARQTLHPTISEGVTGKNGKFGMGLAVPIINNENGGYIGMLVGALPTQEFFERYGNIIDIKSQLVVAIDRKANYLVAGTGENAGKNFFSDEIQQQIGRNPALNEMYKAVLSGRASSAIFGVEGAQRFATASPVYFGEKQVMSIVLSTPLSTVYSQVDDILYLQKIQTLIMLVAVVGTVSALIFYQSRWNRSLENKVKERTQELSDANEQLQLHDKMQKEFINVAAHELRTPIQPILGVTELATPSIGVSAESVTLPQEDFAILKRNAQRLERLSSDILETARIEGGSLVLNKERFSLKEVIHELVSDARKQLKNGDLDIQVIGNELAVYADKGRISQVINNLLANAIKFTFQGRIMIAVSVQDNSRVLFSIRDTGTGIDNEIYPRLFSKFATKSDRGTGLGLYIAKAIVEAHGGKIWAENNREGKGATFTFNLPMGLNNTDTLVPAKTRLEK